MLFCAVARSAAVDDTSTTTSTASGGDGVVVVVACRGAGLAMGWPVKTDSEVLKRNDIGDVQGALLYPNCGRQVYADTTQFGQEVATCAATSEGDGQVREQMRRVDATVAASIG